MTDDTPNEADDADRLETGELDPDEVDPSLDPYDEGSDDEG